MKKIKFIKEFNTPFKYIAKGVVTDRTNADAKAFIDDGYAREVTGKEIKQSEKKKAESDEIKNAEKDKQDKEQAENDKANKAVAEEGK